MKILDIRLKNLNSLRGEWHIDLTDSAYSSEGIFAITGPTGAGKTTIFDAVCLALYGRTSRLSKVSSKENEIMSRGTGSCYAQVTFSTSEGVFTCRWEQRRAYNKSKGTLQDVDHRLSNETTHKPISPETGTTFTEVIRITGMDFARFTQAMMLEQGKFDSFLVADKNNRAAVLELITGTVIYSEISRLVYQRWKDERDSLAKIERDIELIASQEGFGDSEALTRELEAKQTRKSELEAQHVKTNLEFEHLKSIRETEDRLRSIQSEMAAHNRALDTFLPQRKVLDMAERAESIMPDYIELLNARRNHRQRQDDHTKTSGEIADCESEIAHVRDEQIPSLKAKLTQESRGITEAPDAVVTRIVSLVERYEQAITSKNESEAKLTKAQSDLLKAQTAKDSSTRKAQAANDEQQETLNRVMELRARTSSAVLAQERAKLKAGDPCPLCGSREHPGIAHSHSAGEDADSLFRQTEELDRRINELKDTCAALTNEANRAAIEAGRAEQELEHCKNELMTRRADCEHLRESVCDAIRPLGIPDAGNTCGGIKAQAKRWSEVIRKLNDELEAREREQKTLEGILSSKHEELKARQDRLEDSKRELERLEHSFRERLTEKGFIDENIFLASRKAPVELTRLRNQREQLDKRTHELQAIFANLKNSLDEKRAKNLTDDSLEVTGQRFKAEADELNGLIDTIARLHQKLTNIRSLQEQVRALEETRKSQEAVTSRWSELNALLGSANGDKYKVFAQQITLGLVVSHANVYLKNMNGRYELMLTPNSEKLELSVRDNDQAGEIRPTTNLSGGERFIVSLALALGLSQISGSKARVDSLFLDEGFGSLDDDSLNTALEALAEVRREGRMIGIISHVQALKERIAAQINVIPKREGTSIIEGPGCSSK